MTWNVKRVVCDETGSVTEGDEVFRSFLLRKQQKPRDNHCVGLTKQNSCATLPNNYPHRRLSSTTSAKKTTFADCKGRMRSKGIHLQRIYMMRETEAMIPVGMPAAKMNCHPGIPPSRSRTKYKRWSDERHRWQRKNSKTAKESYGNLFQMMMVIESQFQRHLIPHLLTKLAVPIRIGTICFGQPKCVAVNDS